MQRISQLLRKHLQRSRQAFLIMPYFWQYRRSLGIALLMVLLATIADLLFPYLVVRIFSRISSGGLAEVGPDFLALAALYLAAIAGHYFSNIQMTLVGERAVIDLRTALYAHLHRLSLQFFFENHSGDLISHLSGSIATIRANLSFIFTSFVTNLFLFIGVLLILVIVDWRLALVLVLVLFPVTAAGMLLSAILNRLSARVQGHLAYAFRLAEDALQGITTVRAHNQEQYEVSRFRTELEASWQRIMQMTYWQSGLSATLSILGRVAVTIILVLVAQEVFAQRYSMEQVLTFIYYATVLWGAISGLLWLYFTIQITGGATERVFNILQTPVQVQDHLNAAPLSVTHGASLRFERVFFSYDGRQTILQDLNLTVYAGETLAVVGASGAGKTTLSRLLLRLYDPQSGHIYIGDTDIASVTQHSLREQIGLAAQDPFLFAATIMENIRYGSLHASDAEVQQAAILAHAHDFISAMPDAYQTIVGEQGMRLSRGQKQRITLARLILRNPQIIVLDEFTSALDKETEALLTETIRTHFRDRIILLITHHPSLTILADRVALLEDGHISELGTHAELLARAGNYVRLFQLAAE